MSSSDALNALADRFGIFPSFYDLNGVLRTTSIETNKALLRANGLQLDSDAMILEALAQIRARDAERKFPSEIIIASGKPSTVNIEFNGEWRVELEGLGTIAAEGRAEGEINLPPLVSGVHLLLARMGDHEEEITLIVAPKSAPSLGEITGMQKLWGVNAALYGLRSKRNFGLGDFSDLATSANGLAQHGAGFIGINPVHALGWADTESISPYSPSHRGFINSAHIAIDQICALEGSSQTREILAEALASSAAIKSLDVIDYPTFSDHHKRRLRLLYKAFVEQADKEANARFEAFCIERGAALEQFALYEALSEEHGPDWRNWPVGLQSPTAADVERATGELFDQIRFHQWLQWLADAQLSKAHDVANSSGMALGLYLDLAVGARRGGAESWCEQEVVAQGVSLGAPPDHLSPAGQNWDLAAFAPQKMQASRYAAFRRILSDSMRYCGLLRIDHVLGFNRSYWIPDDGSPGAYIRQPFNSLLAIIAIEAQRAGTVIVGEDLGLVPDGFRQTLAASGIYSYSVLQYEKDTEGHFRKPGSLPFKSLACFGTHDTPTLKGFSLGRDIDWWHRLGWIDQKNADDARKQRQKETSELLKLGDNEQAASNSEQEFARLSENVHGGLAQSPAQIVSVQLDDVFGETEAQNLPGTINEHPNWRRRSPILVEEFCSDIRLEKIGKVMSHAGRNPARQKTMEKQNER